MTIKAYPDAQLHNADWLRSTTWDLPTDPDEFLTFLRRQNPTVPIEEMLKRFMTKPAAQAMPQSLREALAKGGSIEMGRDDGRATPA